MSTRASVPQQIERHRMRVLAPGVSLCVVIAWFATALGDYAWFSDRGLSALTLAIVCGIVLGNSLHITGGPTCSEGVAFSKQTLLRAGVVLYGLRLTVQDIAHVGISGVVIDALMIASTFAIATIVGPRWLGLDRKTSMLIGAGSAICGAAAVMATEPVVRARAEQVTVAVATVVVFGTIAIFVYPLLFNANAALHLLPGGEIGFGVYAGSSIHEVAQVVAATRSLGSDVAATAVIAKMVRVMFLAPFLVLLSLFLVLRKEGDDATTDAGTWSSVPWFAICFVAVVLFNSMHLLPRAAVNGVLTIDTLMLATAMAALGLSTRVGSVRQAGAKPLLLAAILAVWLVGGGALINYVINTLIE